ncbi:hypothetical protein KEM56_007387 [Ascosphaera pollenicola]|nr:hypothetical protein KEM56_007387 [Ascosphaera pollenicola]
MPLSKGHLLVIPRKHYHKLRDVGIADSMEVSRSQRIMITVFARLYWIFIDALYWLQMGKWLPILSRVVMKVVLGTEPDPRGDDPAHWNVLQNNGIRASQTVPHVHFHIVPRPPTDYGNGTFDVGSNQVNTAAIVFGKGQRDDLDDEDAERLVRALKEELAAEIERVKSIEGVDLDADFEEPGTHSSDSKIKL